MRAGQASHLQSHKSNLLDERQVLLDEARELWKALHGLPMQHHANFTPDTGGSEVVETADRLGERPLGLYDVVVAESAIRVERDREERSVVAGGRDGRRQFPMGQ